MSADPIRYAEPQRAATGPFLARNPALVAGMWAADVGARILPARAAPLPEGRKLNVLVSNLGHAGDLIVTMPLIAALRAHPRVASVGVLIGPWSRGLAEAGDIADHIHVASHWTLDRGAGGMRAKMARAKALRGPVRAELKAASYNLAIDAYAWFGNTAMLLWEAGVPVRAGFTSGGGGGFFTHRAGFAPNESVAANMARVARLVLPDLEIGPAVYPGFRESQAALEEARALGRYIVVHVGAGDPRRDWPAAHWIALCRSLTEAGYKLAFTGLPAESAQIEPVRAETGGVSFAGKLDFVGFATLIKEAAGLVCVDTGAGHIAACFETPSAILFNGIQPGERWRPQQRFARRASVETACAPCHRTQGCAAMACLRHVTAQEVFAALQDAISAKQGAGGA